MVLRHNVTRKSKRSKSWLNFFFANVLFCASFNSQKELLKEWVQNYYSNNFCKGEPLILWFGGGGYFCVFFYLWREASGYWLMDPALMCFELWLH